ncbi:DNA repair protein rad2 [Pleurotus ostreatus]|uniref:DNA repair protein rad2 n=1 Tax=Pleurotus ostreatus TaxID=5322 RepID=A0A8H6ZM08_PLEOS|nr:DNA repair protein rad2 [Pleurotus ostreatus]KAF7424193.1 DNA repair protein rad2 [Pleurotus ostreatus]KAJ8692949.1 DNA repair protein rad2 [Pleurotus ostreatus]
MGVKSLWSLLTPVGRPVMLETVEGKTMAIDSSIWIYQFQATMRDKEGRALSNAHVLGFLRRITKLLFYGIKPVFVFDGGAPVLKRNTITERKNKKRGAASSHVKVAEKLLAAQLRREALNHIEGAKSSKDKGKGKAESGPVRLDDNTVYLEDLDQRIPRSPVKRVPDSKSPKNNSPKKKFYDHDPYKLPEVDLNDVISKATQSTAPDPRLATEDELQAFIEDMRPEDFDVTSPAFRELPTEVQYEIIGDLRLKSRQTSYHRLQNMLRSARTPLDFSKQQILNLKQRNALTQQLLSTTDSIGKAHIEIPIRIASERNREYVLVKNEGANGGWILGIRDDGTRDKPIEIDQDDDKQAAGNDSDADMDEVDLGKEQTIDEDLRRHRREMALTALSNRYVSKPLAPLTTKSNVVKSKTPLFDLTDDESDAGVNHFDAHSDDDQALAYAIQQSLDSSQVYNAHAGSPGESPKLFTTPPKPLQAKQSEDAILYYNRLETALSIGGAGPSRTPMKSPLFPTKITSLAKPRSPSPQLEYASDLEPASFDPYRPVTPSPSSPTHGTVQDLGSSSDEDMEEVLPVSLPAAVDLGVDAGSSTSEKISPPTVHFRLDPSLLAPADATSKDAVDHSAETKTPGTIEVDTQEQLHPFAPVSKASNVGTSGFAVSFKLDSTILNTNTDQTKAILDDNVSSAEEEEGDADVLSRSPSPSIHDTAEDVNAGRAEPLKDESWDAVQEIDVVAEEDEYVRFMSQVQGKDLDAVRREIDDEIKTLNQERKAAMRDSEDITQQMISQIMTMLRLFGIPYITAPMEAEAQCATLVSLGLVEGIITDDSDVFLFGGQRVFKNMFNQSKTVECFLLADLARELGLGRDTLIRLAYLLGSDYVEGLPGVGPVVAMELLKEFPGEDGLHKFKEWWLKVQSGKDKPEVNKSAFRKRFKKKFKKLYLPQDWPNSAVRDAYYHPTVDESDEPFKWGLPDLDGLRMFLQEELGWHQVKVDELLLPIIQKVGKRVQAAALNKQGTLNEYFDLSVGQGTYAPRKRTAYASKRLQKVVADFRKSNSSRSATPMVEAGVLGSSEDEAGPKKKRTKRVQESVQGEGSHGVARTGKGRGRGKGVRGRGRGRNMANQRAHQESESSASDPTPEGSELSDTGLPPPTLPPAEAKERPRPRRLARV